MMKQPGYWVVWLTTLLIAASLVALPREGAASGPFFDTPPPIIDEGEPDVPSAPALVVGRDRTQIAGQLLAVRAGQFTLFLPVFGHIPRLLHFTWRAHQ